jgi:hypothetical protein
MKNTIKHLVSSFIVLFFLFLAFGSDDSGSSSSSSSSSTPSTPKVMTRQDSIESQFSAWDGSHRTLERLIKDNMNDPDSYEHIETRYRDDKTSIFLYTKFRGANAFGGKVINEVTAKADINGNIIEILSQN